MITIVDYGIGNIGALLNMFEYLGVDAQASGDARVLSEASKLLLPGVGAFDRAMSTLRSRGLVEPLHTAAMARRVPVLGVCLGMQLLASSGSGISHSHRSPHTTAARAPVCRSKRAIRAR